MAYKYIINNICSTIHTGLIDFDEPRSEASMPTLVAGDAGFEKFFNEYQAELDTIGKRPDILLFKKEVFDASLGYDISSKPSNEIGDYVAKAIAGIEVRSSDQGRSIGDVKELPTMFTKETSNKKVSYTCFEGGKIAVNINKLTA